jgi:hypothetical protein
MVSYHGVHVEVPSAWPVLDGMHISLCSGPFPSTPTVFLGPNYNGAIGCPAAIRLPALDGVWLSPGTQPQGAREITSSRHVTVLEARPGWDRHVVQVWYRHVSIEIGIGRNPRIAHRILASVGYSRGQPDTRDTGDCARTAGMPAMPAPARLARRLVIEQGDITLNPPLPSDQPAMTAAAAWQQAEGNRASMIAPFLRYRLLLVRYSSKYPASPGPNGTYVPMDRDVLAWVVYSQPRTPIAGCGGWGLDSFNALTGGGISSDGWSPGP